MATLTAKAPRASASRKIVRDASTGRTVEVRGFGALKGQLHIAEGVDLTKPIYDQVKRMPARSALAPKHS